MAVLKRKCPVLNTSVHLRTVSEIDPVTGLTAKKKGKEKESHHQEAKDKSCNICPFTIRIAIVF